MADYADTAFLRSILTVPDEDTPRLVYADYLEENGQGERAEFIRLQCELATIPRFAPRFNSLKTREQELLRYYQVEWRQQLPMLQRVHWEAFERGFVACVRIDDPYSFFAHVQEIFESAPIQRLSLHGLSAQEARRLAEIPELRKVRVLDLDDGNRIGNAGLEGLSESPFLTELRTLKLRHNIIATTGIRALARSPIVKKLCWLDLDSNQIFSEGVELLADAPLLGNLTTLSLDWTRSGTQGAIALAQSNYLTKLHSLYLTGNEIDDAGAIALANASHHEKLQVLYLNNNRIGNAGAVALASSPILVEQARCLYLRNNRIGDLGAWALARSPHLGEVRELILGDNPISDEAGQVLRQRFGKRVWLW